MTCIYTRSGDQGQTGLANGTRTAKSSPRIEALGAVDECNAHLGMLVALLAGDHPLHAHIERLQHQLFDLGAILAGVDSPAIGDTKVRGLEAEIDHLDKALPPLKQFILPGGNAPAAQAHIARAVCRRAERCVFTLAEQETVPAALSQYLNRLSDLLFVVARTLAQEGSGDVLWQPRDAR
ncbi:MAG: cob(I)yrinic acid a,c-diamide adenosyltransferase [Porticoccaceae bacterium]